MEGDQPPLTAGEHPGTSFAGLFVPYNPRQDLARGQRVPRPAKPGSDPGRDQPCSPSPLSLSPGLMKKS